MSEYTDWWENLMRENKRCPACEQDDYYNSPNACFDGFPCAWDHNFDSPACRENKLTRGNPARFL